MHNLQVGELMCFKPRKPNDEMIIKNSNKQSELYFSMYLTVVKLILNITFFVAFSLLLYVSKSISFYFLLNVMFQDTHLHSVLKHLFPEVSGMSSTW